MDQGLPKSGREIAILDHAAMGISEIVLKQECRYARISVLR
jgi:hypothetical protein